MQIQLPAAKMVAKHDLTMKRTHTFAIGITVLLGIVGCSTSSSKVAVRHLPDPAMAATVEDARSLYEKGRIDDAEQKLLQVLAVEPKNLKAYYYLTLVQECRAARQQEQTNPTPLGFYQTYSPQPFY